MTNSLFDNIWLSKLSAKEQEEVIENIYLQAIVNSYQCINKSVSLENEIRDRFY